MNEPVDVLPEVFKCQITTRWRDFDANRHVNNAVFLTYLEHAREVFFEAAGVERDGNVLARTELDFRAPIELSTREVCCQITCLRLGNTSVITSESLVTDAGVALQARSVSVLVDPSGQSTKIPNQVRSELGRYLAPETNEGGHR